MTKCGPTLVFFLIQILEEMFDGLRYDISGFKFLLVGSFETFSNTKQTRLSFLLFGDFIKFGTNPRCFRLCCMENDTLMLIKF